MSEPVILRDVAATGLDEAAGLRLDWAVACHVGSIRPANEDAALALPGRYLLADGMGGHESGELASEAALQTLASAPVGVSLAQTSGALEGLLVEAQDRIGGLDAETARRAGTTATGVVLAVEHDAPHWVAFNIGDSRTYLISGGRIKPVSVDHSQVQELVDGGFLTPAQARVDPRRNVITRALGAGMATPRADYFAFPAVPGDIVLLCSDGLNGELTDDEILAAVTETDSLEEAAEALVECANISGGHDNVTVVLVRVAE
ncbi:MULTISPECIES: PP2C family protein-serine/threonine phosphatase [unclassified Gordonia (in: high G+C Gram-positive bacteria)]|uniref:PP2C family protein-serine/threonine phosphatase n=1 Tax=unclassified Gordonia (in: high G+C Gram-positive bacteria) TaxID=2657482 RepID=UPI001FFEF48A|nr:MULTISPECIES: protein phosphatase 2C domain-containing protein [unclassified Gordonia (in: high G+C Gram-positive bacteria)]UQE73247.1 protein phosphatase 2C domain-containing protein [Gordonia sp. PP30]